MPAQVKHAKWSSKGGTRRRGSWRSRWTRVVPAVAACALLAMPGDPLRVAGVADRCRAGMGWSGHIPLRRSDGSRVDVDLRVSASFRVGADECFLISARAQHQQ